MGAAISVFLNEKGPRVSEKELKNMPIGADSIHEATNMRLFKKLKYAH